jgi:hypothetical protein
MVRTNAADDTAGRRLLVAAGAAVAAVAAVTTLPVLVRKLLEAASEVS